MSGIQYPLHLLGDLLQPQTDCAVLLGRFDIPGATATLGELAVDKNTAGEAPYPFAHVAVFRLIDFKKVWEGFADAQGRWQADGLQPGLEYVAIGIDLQRVYKATAAGPVKASVEGGDG